MSIITEALKKAESESKKITNEQNRHYESLEQFTPVRRDPYTIKDINKRFLFKPLYIVYILFISGIVLLYIINQGMNRQPSSNNTVTTSQNEILKDEPDIPSSFDKQSLTSDSFHNDSKNDDVVLSGIMYNKNKPLAVLNNYIMKEGDKVGGIKVLKIRQDSVDIDNRGESLTLNLKH